MTRGRGAAGRGVRLLVAVALLLGLSGCGQDGEPRIAAATDRCGPVEMPGIQGGAHLLQGRPPPVPYNSVPPTSGWHASGEFPIGVHGTGDALEESRQVSVLEAGAVVVTYRGLSDADRGEVELVAQRDFPGRVAVTPYDRLGEGEVALTAWGSLQRCQGLDLEALGAFVATYALEEPALPGLE